MVTLHSYLKRTSQQRERASLHLRQADKFVKEGNLLFALDSIFRAKIIDPRNPYSIAYEERVLSLIRVGETNAANITEEPVSVNDFASRVLDIFENRSSGDAVYEIARAIYTHPNDIELECSKNQIIESIVRGEFSATKAA